MSPRPLPLLAFLSLISITAEVRSQAVVTEWPGAVFENAVVGHFLGGYHPCVVVVRGGQLHFDFEPGRFAVTVPVACLPGQLTGVTGVVNYRFPDAASDEGDILLVATSTGVVRGQFVTVGDHSVFAWLPVLGSSWNGARHLSARIRNHLRPFAFDIAGRSAAGNNLLLAVDLEGSVQHLRTVPAASAISATHARGWGGSMSEPLAVTNGGFGIAAAGSSNLVIDCASNLTIARTWPVKFGGVDRIGMGWGGYSATQQSIVWCAPQCQGLAHTELPADGLTPVGQVIVSGAAFDLDDDGTQEVLVARNGDFRYWIGGAAGGTERFTVVPGATGAPQANQCPFFWQDFDGDQAPDLLAFWNAGITTTNGDPTKAVVFRSDLRPSPGNVLPAGNRPQIGSGGLVQGASYDGEGEKLYLFFDPGCAAPGRQIHVTAWRQPNPYVDSATYWDAAYRTPEPDLDLKATASFAFAFQDIHDADAEHIVPLGSAAGWLAGEHYYLHVRLVDWQDAKVLKAEVDGIRIFPSAAWTDYVARVGSDPTGFLQAMMRHVLDRRIDSSTVPLSISAGFVARPPLGGVPTGGIVINTGSPDWPRDQLPSPKR